MKRVFSFATWLMVTLTICTSAIAQAPIARGVVTNQSDGSPVAAASVVVKGSTIGTYTSDKGEFELAIPDIFPVVLEVTAVGFAPQTVTITANNQTVEVSMTPAAALGQEVVVSATRTPARLLESPVSIERVSNTAIRQAPAANYYDMAWNLKGVDVVTSSLTFKTPATRGFNGSGNLRVNQLMDGMDNQAPGLNFSVGSIIGLTELDVESMELLQGASSALYGPGGMNGTVIIQGKNPFKYQGLSFQVKTGVMHTDQRQRDVSGYHNWAVRWGQKVSDKFAFKIGSEFIQAQDWLADDFRNYKRLGTTGEIVPGTRETDPNFDGVNIYGDETTSNIRSILDIFANAYPPWRDFVNTLPANMPVSRTGYTEKEVADPNTRVFKLSGAAHYKLTRRLEAVLAAHWGTGTSVYTGSDRYTLKDFKIGQYKLELNHKYWNLRAYTTQENSGDSYNLTIGTRLFNEEWKPSTTWYPQYSLAYLNARLAGQDNITAHNTARGVADVGRPEAGSERFRELYNTVTSRPIPLGGGFLDRSDLYMVEGQYNLSHLISFAEILVGGNWKQYVLNSQGTLFADEPGSPIKINEGGGYVQVSKNLFGDFLRLSASGRYDKNQNFEGRFTPRVTALLKVAKNHNIRASYQTAYRFPSTQQQWIDLAVGSGRLIGENRSLWEKYNLIANPGYNPTNLNERVEYQATKPEAVTSYELGYKGLIKSKLLIDIYGYFGQYKDFITRRDVIQFQGAPGTSPFTGYSVVVNAPEEVTTWGWGASLDYLLPANFTIGLNASGDNLDDVPAGFRAFFNAPSLRTNVSFGNNGFGKKKVVGFNMSWRWQDEVFWESDFAQGTLPAFHNVDASVNFRMSKIGSIFKIGANNLLNSYYRTAVGNPSIGGLYYISFSYNVL